MEKDKAISLELEELLTNFDKNLKIAEFYLNTETFYELRQTNVNILKITQRLADASSILANIHGLKYEFSEGVQLDIYDKVRRRFDEFEHTRENLHAVKQKYEQLLLKEKNGLTNIKDIVPNMKFSEGREVDLHLITDYNERLLQEVGLNLREVDLNMKETSHLLNKQGQALKKSQVMIGSTERNIKASDSTITSLSRGQICQRLLMHVIVILLFIIIIIIAGMKLYYYSSKNG